MFTLFNEYIRIHLNNLIGDECKINGNIIVEGEKGEDEQRRDG